MIAADETFNGTWPYKPQFFEGNGFRQHFIGGVGHFLQDDGPEVVVNQGLQGRRVQFES